MRLDLGTESDRLLEYIAGIVVLRDEPLDDATLIRLKGVETRITQITITDYHGRALDVLIDLSDVGANLGRLGSNVGCYRVAHSVVRAAARAGAVIALSVETARVALVVLGVGTLDELEREELVALVAASEDAFVADSGSVALLDIGPRLALDHVLLCGEEGVSTARRLASSKVIAHTSSLANSLANRKSTLPPSVGTLGRMP